VACLGGGEEYFWQRTVDLVFLCLACCFVHRYDWTHVDPETLSVEGSFLYILSALESNAI